MGPWPCSALAILQPRAGWGPGSGLLLPPGSADPRAAAHKSRRPPRSPRAAGLQLPACRGPGAVFLTRPRAAQHLPGPELRTRGAADPQAEAHILADPGPAAREGPGAATRPGRLPSVRLLQPMTRTPCWPPTPGVGTVRRGEALRPDVWVVRPWDRPRGGGEVGRACRSPESSRRAGNPCGMTGGRARSARYPRRRELRGAGGLLPGVGSGCEAAGGMYLKAGGCFWGSGEVVLGARVTLRDGASRGPHVKVRERLPGMRITRLTSIY